ncbi:MAG: hypothetical protein ACKVOK_10680 [Flavobacteriales bacterium]
MKYLISLLLSLCAFTSVGQDGYSISLGSSLTTNAEGLPVYMNFRMPFPQNDLFQFGVDLHTYRYSGLDEDSNRQKYRAFLITIPYSISLSSILTEREQNFDPYAGVAIGFQRAFQDGESYFDGTGLKLFAFGGLRYYFSEEWGIGMQFDYGTLKSLKFGVCMRY